MMRERLRRVALATLALGLLLPIVGAGPALRAATPEPEAAQPVPTQLPEEPFAGLSERFRVLAKRDERSKDWHRALMRWEAVAAMEKTDAEAKRHIAAIRRVLGDNAARHFAAAKDAYQKKQFAKAFREFLHTLSYDPENQLALTMVKYELNAKSLTEYKVKRGDTLREIAVAEYKDPDLTFLVRYYNGIRNPRDLKVGQVLMLPVMVGVGLRKAPAPEVAAKPAPRPKAAETPAATAEVEASEASAETASVVVADGPLSVGASIVAEEVRPSAQVEQQPNATASSGQFEEARKLFAARKYEAAAGAAEALLEEDPANAEARELFSAAYYEHGLALRDRKDYIASMQALSRVEPSYKDVETVLASVKGQVGDQTAEVHYVAGVQYFINEDLDNAVKEWEETLRLDSNHPQARKDLENAKSLRAKLAQVR